MLDVASFCTVATPEARRRFHWQELLHSRQGDNPALLQPRRGFLGPQPSGPQPSGCARVDAIFSTLKLPVGGTKETCPDSRFRLVEDPQQRAGKATTPTAVKTYSTPKVEGLVGAASELSAPFTHSLIKHPPVALLSTSAAG